MLLLFSPSLASSGSCNSKVNRTPPAKSIPLLIFLSGGSREMRQKPTSPKVSTVPMSRCLLSESVPKYQMKRANKARPMEKDVIGVILYYLLIFLKNRGRKPTSFCEKNNLTLKLFRHILPICHGMVDSIEHRTINII